MGVLDMLLELTGHCECGRAGRAFDIVRETHWGVGLRAMEG